MDEGMRRALYLPLVVLAAGLAVLCVLLVPLRLGTTLVWLAVVVAAVGTALVCRAGLRLTGRRAGAGLPLIVWLVTLYGAGLTGPGGDVLVPAEPTLGLVPVYVTTLLAGVVAGGLATFWRPTPGADGSR